MRSREIVEIIADVVKRTSEDCNITLYGFNGESSEITCPEINYTFGNTQYVKDKLDVMSKSASTRIMKFPMIALFCPFKEQRNSPDFYTKAKVNVLIACSSDKKWENERRLQTSFICILRPIYNRFIEALKEDGRLDFGYENMVKHEYSENYSYGRYGAFTATGEEVSEPIDAINISNLELTVKNPNCRIQ